MLRRVRNPLLVAAACSALLVVPARAEAGDGKKLLPLLADTTELVAVLDIADARDAATFDALLDNAPSKLADFLAVLTAAGLDARQDIDTMLIGGRGETYQVVLEGRFDKKKLVATGMIASSTVKKHRGVRYWSGADGDVMLLGKRLVLTTAGEMTGVIDRHKKKGRSLTRSPDAAAIREAIGLVDARHDVWFAAAGALLADDGVDAMGFGLTFGTDLTIEAKARIADAERADDMRAAADQGMPRLVQTLEQLGLEGLASSLVIEWDGPIVGAGATVPADELETLLRLAAML